MSAIDSARVAEQAAQWLHLLGEGELSELDAIEFERWMAESSLHSEIFADMAATWDLASELTEPTVQAKDHRAFEDTGANNVLPLAARSKRAAPKPPFFLALAATVAAMGVFWFWQSTSEQSVQVARFETKPGELRELQLSDGSFVALSGDSILESDLHGALRELKLVRGEAFFQIARDGRGMEVSANQMRVKIVGTAFNIDVVNTTQASLTVYEGRVEVRSGASNVALSAGSHVDVLGTHISPPSAQAASSPDWRSGWFEADQTELTRIIAETNRFSTSPITLAEGLGTIKLSGRIRVADPELVLRSLERMKLVKVVRQNQRIRLERSTEPESR